MPDERITLLVHDRKSRPGLRSRLRSNLLMRCRSTAQDIEIDQCNSTPHILSMGPELSQHTAGPLNWEDPPTPSPKRSALPRSRPADRGTERAIWATKAAWALGFISGGRSPLCLRSLSAQRFSWHGCEASFFRDHDLEMA